MIGMPFVGIVYHAYQESDGSYTDCPDGIVAASIVANYYLELGYFQVEVIPDSYKPKSYYEHFENPLLSEKYAHLTDIIIVDFSYPRHWLEELEKTGKYVYVFDHHIKQLEAFDLANFSNAIYPKDEVSDCAATLVWKYYKGKDSYIPNIIRQVRNRDIGLHGYYEGEIPLSEQINIGLTKLKSAYKEGYMSHNNLVGYCEWLYDFITNDKNALICQVIGEPIITKRDKDIEDLFSEIYNVCYCVWGENQIKVVHIDLPLPEYKDLQSHYSVVTHKFLKWARKVTDINFDCAVFEHETGDLSFRSDGYDTYPLALSLGGGGHSKASGAGKSDLVTDFLNTFHYTVKVKDYNVKVNFEHEDYFETL